MVGIPVSGRRVVIEAVTPQVDGGRFPAKRILGDRVVVEADVFADGHELISTVLRHRQAGGEWSETPMTALGNDRWRGEFEPDRLGRWEFAIEGWVDHFRTWRDGLEKKTDAGLDVTVDLLIGAQLVEAAGKRAASGADHGLGRLAARLADPRIGVGERVTIAFSPELADSMSAYPDRSRSTVLEEALQIMVLRQKARFSAWYELFPRSWSDQPGGHGTFADVEDQLGYVAGLGFDVLYLPPIHPIGTTHRKGANNTLEAGPDDPGVPWAIGSEEGGHTAIHPRLGSIEEFRSLRDRAAAVGLELALDIAFQCSPDHPWVEEHPEWFRHRPDGTVQYAENPPKRYQDIYPLDFETDDLAGLWSALKDVFDHWIEEGIRIFRVDNPHTKSFAFWEWVIGEIGASHPDVIFLSEAFTRPAVMYRLAKLGFTQSYTYFTWRTTVREMSEYMAQLAQVEDFFIPSFWPNTPDILPFHLQTGERSTFVARLVLASTLSSNFGIYGPAFELMEHTPLEPGSEEYRDSEKYEIRRWDLADPGSLAGVIRTINRIRGDHPALQANHGLRIHATDNPSLMCYSKQSGDDLVLVVASFDTSRTQTGWVELDLGAWSIDSEHGFQVHDLLTDDRYVWRGEKNHVELDPGRNPAYVFSVEPVDGAQS